MVEPFSGVGMVTQVSAIQAVTEATDRSPCSCESLPMHLRDLLDQTSGTKIRFNSANWRVSFFVIWICSLPRDQH